MLEYIKNKIVPEFVKNRIFPNNTNLGKEYNQRDQINNFIQQVTDSNPVLSNKIQKVSAEEGDYKTKLSNFLNFLKLNRVSPQYFIINFLPEMGFLLNALNAKIIEENKFEQFVIGAFTDDKFIDNNMEELKKAGLREANIENIKSSLSKRENIFDLMNEEYTKIEQKIKDNILNDLITSDNKGLITLAEALKNEDLGLFSNILLSYTNKNLKRLLFTIVEMQNESYFINEDKLNLFKAELESAMFKKLYVKHEEGALIDKFYKLIDEKNENLLAIKVAHDKILEKKIIDKISSFANENTDSIVEAIIEQNSEMLKNCLGNLDDLADNLSNYLFSTDKNNISENKISKINFSKLKKFLIEKFVNDDEPILTDNLKQKFDKKKNIIEYLENCKSVYRSSLKQDLKNILYFEFAKNKNNLDCRYFFSELKKVLTGEILLENIDKNRLNVNQINWLNLYERIFIDDILDLDDDEEEKENQKKKLIKIVETCQNRTISPKDIHEFALHEIKESLSEQKSNLVQNLDFDDKTKKEFFSRVELYIIEKNLDIFDIINQMKNNQDEFIKRIIYFSIPKKDKSLFQKMLSYVGMQNETASKFELSEVDKDELKSLAEELLKNKEKLEDYIITKYNRLNFSNEMVKITANLPAIAKQAGIKINKYNRIVKTLKNSPARKAHINIPRESSLLSLIKARTITVDSQEQNGDLSSYEITLNNNDPRINAPGDVEGYDINKKVISLKVRLKNIIKNILAINLPIFRFFTPYITYISPVRLIFSGIVGGLILDVAEKIFGNIYNKRHFLHTEKQKDYEISYFGILKWAGFCGLLIILFPMSKIMLVIYSLFMVAALKYDLLDNVLNNIFSLISAFLFTSLIRIIMPIHFTLGMTLVSSLIKYLGSNNKSNPNIIKPEWYNSKTELNMTEYNLKKATLEKAVKNYFTDIDNKERTFWQQTKNVLYLIFGNSVKEESKSRRDKINLVSIVIGFLTLNIFNYFIIYYVSVFATSLYYDFEQKKIDIQDTKEWVKTILKDSEDLMISLNRLNKEDVKLLSQSALAINLEDKLVNLENITEKDVKSWQKSLTKLKSETITERG